MTSDDALRTQNTKVFVGIVVYNTDKEMGYVLDGVLVSPENIIKTNPVPGFSAGDYIKITIKKI